MSYRKALDTRCALLVMVLLWSTAGRAVEPVSSATASDALGFIVQYRSTPVGPPTANSMKLFAGSLADRSGTKLRATRDIGPGLQALGLVPDDASRSPADLLRSLHGPLFINQWYLQSAQPAAVDALGAWDITTGDTDVVVAVLDTGIRYDHPDLGRVSNGGRVLPGYDFVSGESNGTFLVANDNNGRDADASDPGDWLTTADHQQQLLARHASCRHDRGHH